MSACCLLAASFRQLVLRVSFAEHTAQMRTTVQYMLLQNAPLLVNHTKNGTVYSSPRTPIWLFAALPRDIEVHFKLPAFHNTTVEARCKDNAIVSLTVTPKERKKVFLSPQ